MCFHVLFYVFIFLAKSRVLKNCIVKMYKEPVTIREVTFVLLCVKLTY